MSGKREFGDYQTPVAFADYLCHYLCQERNISPSVVVEPTCGTGNFLESSLSFNANYYYGIEINPAYCDYCKKHITDNRVSIINSDFFTLSTKNLINDLSNILVIGYPPWVTNSTLSALGLNNYITNQMYSDFKALPIFHTAEQLNFI